MSDGRLSCGRLAMGIFRALPTPHPAPARMIHPPPAPSPAPPAHGGTLRRELARKALHLSSAAIPVAYALGAPRGPLLLLLGSLVSVALVVEGARRVSPAARGWFLRVFGRLLRQHERGGLVGATWMLLAYTGAVWLTPAPVAIAATWAVAAGDASAALVGRAMADRAGRSPADGRKTWWGSAGCAGVSAAGAYALAGLSPVLALLVGLVAAGAERPAGPGDDNLRITLAVCALLMLARAFSA